MSVYMLGGWVSVGVGVRVRGCACAYVCVDVCARVLILYYLSGSNNMYIFDLVEARCYV